MGFNSAFKGLIIFLCFISLSNSSLVLTLHIWFSFVGPNILLKIFLSKTNNFLIIFSFSIHVSEAYVTTGLITVLYNFNFDCLVTNLLLNNFRFAQYAFVPRTILSLISSSIELLIYYFNANLISFLRPSNCATIGEKTLIILIPSSRLSSEFFLECFTPEDGARQLILPLISHILKLILSAAINPFAWVHTCNVTAYRTPYCDSVDGTRDRVTYQKLVTR